MQGGQHCSYGSLAVTHLERLWQLLGHALGNLTQLAQRPVGLQAPQSTRQGPHRSLILAIILRGERDLQARGQAAFTAASLCWKDETVLSEVGTCSSGEPLRHKTSSHKIY